MPTTISRTNADRGKAVRLAVPDFVSNSYFPALAASALGFYERAGVQVEVLHLSPVDSCAAALANGDVDFIGASAHVPLLAFPRWQGVKLICAQSQGLYWLLVVRKSLGLRRGDLAALKGRRIAAVPLVAAALRRILLASALDVAHVDIVSPESALRPGVNFGVAAAEALASGTIDGFFANGMGAAIAVEAGVGEVLLDIRRGDGPAECFHYTMPAIATTDRLLGAMPDVAAGVVRAIVAVQNALRADLSLAKRAASIRFPPEAARLLPGVVAADLPYYSPVITADAVAAMNAYAGMTGLPAARSCRLDDVVAVQLAPLWTTSATA